MIASNCLYFIAVFVFQFCFYIWLDWLYVFLFIWLWFCFQNVLNEILMLVCSGAYCIVRFIVLHYGHG